MARISIQRAAACPQASYGEPDCASLRGVVYCCDVRADGRLQRRRGQARHPLHTPPDRMGPWRRELARRSPGRRDGGGGNHQTREDSRTVANVASMKQLLEAGVHFGHQTRRWNPKMRPFIFTAKNGIHILDLQQTVARLNEAYRFITSLTANGDAILFVGTKKQAQEAIKESAERSGQF